MKWMVFAAALAALPALAPLVPAHAADSDALSPNKTFVASPFSDNMVLQRNMADPVWGWSTPGDKVAVAFDGKPEGSATAGADGFWMVKLPQMPASDSAHTMAVSGSQTKVSFSNILIGDVWLCSGQSNMEFGVGMLANPQAETADANYPDIRLCLAPHQVAVVPKDSNTISWVACSPQTLSQAGWGGFTAVGYFFGRDLYQKLGIPIGLIESSWGGTVAEAWTSEQALAAHMPDFQPKLAALDAMRSQIAQNPTMTPNDFIEQWYLANDPGSLPSAAWWSPSFDDSAWGTMPVPSYYQQAGIPTLAGVNGLIWYRYRFDVPDADAGMPARLEISVDDQDSTWINGVHVGSGYNAGGREYQVPAGVLKAGSNLIAVRVLDIGGLGGLPGSPANTNLVMLPGGSIVPLAGSWKYDFEKNLQQLPAPPQSIVGNPNFPTALFNGMINPLIPYGIKGAIWYQGESNAGRGFQYRTLLPTMITDWRDRWHEPDFPFLIVQLANYGSTTEPPGDDAWAEVREAQMLTAQHLSNSGFAVTDDIGDPTNIHPKNKEEVGRRLSLIAFDKVYGMPTEYAGPLYKSIKVEGSTIRISFTHTTGGLVAKGGEPLTGFTIAGADHKWQAADAKIDGDTVVVSSPNVPQPVAVRFAWASSPTVNLDNGFGLPAPPFRTDDWPISSEGNK